MCEAHCSRGNAGQTGTAWPAARFGYGFRSCTTWYAALAGFGVPKRAFTA